MGTPAIGCSHIDWPACGCGEYNTETEEENVLEMEDGYTEWEEDELDDYDDNWLEG